MPITVVLWIPLRLFVCQPDGTQLSLHMLAVKQVSEKELILGDYFTGYHQ